jgi:hypothetical protein
MAPKATKVALQDIDERLARLEQMLQRLLEATENTAAYKNVKAAPVKTAGSDDNE